MKKVLIVEDDENICQLLNHLFQEKYQLTIVRSGTEGVIRASEETFDLVILDLMLPGVTGESVLKSIKKESAVPVIIMTAVNDKKKTVELLKEGAADYVTKPFDIEELEARIEVQLRNTAILAPQEKTMAFKNLTLNMASYEVSVRSKQIDISHKEYQLLELLLSYPNKIYSKANLYERVWGDSYIGGENTVNVHISTLRKKLKAADPDNEYIETIWGMGIRLAKEDS
ncbi:response regulator transcription factor [Enterococcus sp. BWM-S5]|uniref:Response regulator transcription factor n=1 Tax=Enterococcus larvae TaxID=2794352 RepID=A0ABS4CM32_9ENTE|nr:response regulator transcription factor [Enterococcus larvae]MBP1047548.1 response regulator transcription factor [Enterococcus larvae]